MSELDDDSLLEALGVEAEAPKSSRYTAVEERIIAGFEDILRFYETNGRAPLHGEERDIFERLYAVRLDQLRKLPEARKLLAPMDTRGLLVAAQMAETNVDLLDEDALLDELGVSAEPADGDIRELRHVRSRKQIEAAEEIAGRTPCKDFDTFAPLFAEAESGLKAGTWMTKPFVKDATIQVGDFFIVGGQVVYVAEMLPGTTTRDGRDNPRLRVIYDNHTESNLLLRSLSRSLYPDGDVQVGRRLIRQEAGPLFEATAEPDDIKSGTIYVLRSQSAHPFIADHRELIHKIGVTGGKVETRISGAALDPTYLLADVEIVATYALANIHRTKLEKIIHRIFESAQLDLALRDRFGLPVKPREWFVVPLPVIDEAVQRIRDGSITGYLYDPAVARLVAQEVSGPETSP